MLVAALLLTVTGCTSNKAYTYSVETGDSIKIELDTTDGYDMTSDLPFIITKGNEELSQGTFITLDSYNQYIAAVDADSLATIIEEGSVNGVQYVFYEYNDSEYNYIIKIDNSNTGVLLGNPISKESAEECFERLAFTKE